MKFRTGALQRPVFRQSGLLSLAVLKQHPCLESHLRLMKLKLGPLVREGFLS
jgi:hypothetical protein